MSDSKITAINGGSKPDAMLEALRGLKKNFDVAIEYELYRAKLTRARFDALVKEGFSEAQALELCKAP